MRSIDPEAARRIALRAAKAVSIGLAFTTGCAGAHDGSPVVEDDGAQPDGAVSRAMDPEDAGVLSQGDTGIDEVDPTLPTAVDGGTVGEEEDAAIAVLDAEVTPDDAAVEDAAIADAATDVLLVDGAVPCEYPTFDGEDAEASWQKYSDCCNANGWKYELGCFAWGPFVPPSEVV